MKKNEVMGRLHQQGMTTLTISLIVLFLMSLIILFTSSNALFEFLEGIKPGRKKLLFFGLPTAW